MSDKHDKHTNPKHTGKNAASKAGEQLGNKKSTAAEKTVAGSDLSQAPVKNAGKKKK